MPTDAEKTKIVIVSKTGSLTESIVETNKETTLDELTTILSKKCANKKSDGFSCYHTYKYKNKKKGVKGAGVGAGASYLYIDVWCKTDGRAGQENKYELPPPIDEIIFFGNIALVARIDTQRACDLSIELWNKIYEKLFGGFEDLATTAKDDENEIDELAFVPASKKTANGYLKDGFIVDDSPSTSGDDVVGSCVGNKTKTKTKTKKSKTIKSDSTTTESEFVTETDTETDTISDTDSRSSSSSGDRKITPSIKKTGAVSVSVSVSTPTSAPKKKPTKKDELARSAAAAAAVAAILGDSCDSELSEDSYS